MASTHQLENFSSCLLAPRACRNSTISHGCWLCQLGVEIPGVWRAAHKRVQLRLGCKIEMYRHARPITAHMSNRCHAVQETARVWTCSKLLLRTFTRSCGREGCHFPTPTHKFTEQCVRRTCVSWVHSATKFHKCASEGDRPVLRTGTSKERSGGSHIRVCCD